MRWPWELRIPKPPADPTGPISSEEVEKVKDQLNDWQRRLEVVEKRIERLPPAAAR